jgi:hypothetical protein
MNFFDLAPLQLRRGALAARHSQTISVAKDAAVFRLFERARVVLGFAFQKLLDDFTCPTWEQHAVNEHGSQQEPDASRNRYGKCIHCFAER